MQQRCFLPEGALRLQDGDRVQLARMVWMLERPRGRTDEGAAERALGEIVKEQSELYRAIFVKLTTRQQGVLRAFGVDANVQITSARAIARHTLGPKSTVQSTVSTLVEDEHLTRLEDGRYAFDDPFFRRWVQLHALPDIGEAVPPLAATESA